MKYKSSISVVDRAGVHGAKGSGFDLIFFVLHIPFRTKVYYIKNIVVKSQLFNFQLNLNASFVIIKIKKELFAIA